MIKPIFQLFSRAWIEHSKIETGGMLELEMTDQPSDWGKDILPPSLEF